MTPGRARLPSFMAPALAAALAFLGAACDRSAPGPADPGGGNDTIPGPTVPNRPPVFEEAQPPDWIIPGVYYLFTLRAADPDGDSLAFAGTFPPGAALDGDVLRWIPVAAEAGRQAFHFTVQDGHGHADTLDFSIEVLGFDPWPYTADPRKNRVWRIRGYAMTVRDGSGSARDSVALSRTLTLTASLRENSSFTFRVADTLGGDAEGTRDTAYAATFLEGREFAVANVSGLIPFAWPKNAFRAESLQVTIGDSVFAARKEIEGEPCPGDEAPPWTACVWSERIFAAGWGVVSRRSETRDPAKGELRREAYEAWSVSGP